MGVVGMNNLQLAVFHSRDELELTLLKKVVDSLVLGIKERGRATLVVSGGSTPKALFQRLSCQLLDWSKVTITLADDRWLPESHPDSNAKLLRDFLLVNEATAARFIPLVDIEQSPDQVLSLNDQLLSSLGRFDVVLLGMGEDGHTASLFPEADNIAQGLAMDSGKQCLIIEPKTAAYTRISMTLPRLLDCRQLFIHITGNSKHQLLSSLLSVPAQMAQPISYVLSQKRIPVAVYWAE